MVSCDVPDYRHALQNLVVTLEAALESGDESPPCKLTSEPDLPPTLSDIFNHSLLLVSFGQMAQEVVRRICALKMDKSLLTGSEGALSFVF